ncbi:MAG: prephenate dehydrogenase/arogenate dehydrogenase family protein [Negativicutes bacterium]|nr:prephenate dehydrogenase/arogenate dehydrogenase family protein [Negativicutes bacterium]
MGGIYIKLGFIGFGEVGFEMAKGYKAEGLEGILAYDVMQEHPVYGDLVKERVQNSGVTLVPSPEEVLQNVDVVIVAVPGSKALETAKELRPFLKKETLYVDVSASSPEIKRNIWEEIKETGASFVDGAMLGPLTVYQHKVPTLLSGNGSDKFLELMLPYGMDLEKVSDIPGEATGIKFVRSIFMKGLPALLVEVLEAASIMKVDHLVLKSLATTMNACTFEQTLNRLVTGSAVHAERRAHEIKDVIAMLESINVQATMSKATYERLTWLASKKLKEKFGGKTPKEWQEVVKAWEQAGN